VLLWLHVSLAVSCVVLLAGQFMGGQRRARTMLLISVMLAGTMASGIALLIAAGGLEQALFFGHVMHWLGWLAVLTWAHALFRRHVSMAPPAVGLPLLMMMAACAAGLLAMVQERI
jgi:hypothetical protein